MRVRCTACLILVLAPVAAQNAPRFEVASVRPTETNTTSGPPLGYRITGTQVRWSGLSVKDYISVAYALEPPQIIAPEWTREVRFEVSANLPPGSTRQEIPQMLRTLLAERFQLRIHEESRQFPIYALTVGKRG